jgi:eukaryotic-like serine/threonine-protein kinase
MSSTSQGRQAFAAAADSSFASSGTGDWQPPEFAEFAADLQQSHPHYRVTSFFKKGGMGAVYRAVDTRSGTALAIKMMRPDFLTDTRDVARFQRESTILLKLHQDQLRLGKTSHPHLISLLDHGETPGGHHFLVMPWLGERTLAHYTTGPKMPTQRVLQLMHQLCAGIAHAHENGIIHRDLKPSNILLADPDERAVILDFGIARACVPVDDLGTLSRPGDRPGTHGYMSPSRLAGQEAAQADDIYSLAAIFYQLITGELLQGYPRPLSEFDQRLDARFDDILAKALHADPTQRYKDANEFSQALQDLTPIDTMPQATPVADDKYPTPDPASITIEFGETSLVVNGLDFSLSTTIEDWMQVLGRYSEVETVRDSSGSGQTKLYYWHHLGLACRTFRHFTERIYIAPPVTSSVLAKAQSELFCSGKHVFTSFSGSITINQAQLGSDLTVFDLQEVDRRYHSGKPYLNDATAYDLRGVNDRINGTLALKSMQHAGEDDCRLYTFIQSGIIHDVPELEATLCESNYWASAVQVIRFGSFADRILTLSFTRLYINHEVFHNRLAGDETWNTSFLRQNERPLLRMVGSHSGRKQRVFDGWVNPEEMVLTDQRLIVRQTQTKQQSIELSTKPSLGILDFDPPEKGILVGLLKLMRSAMKDELATVADGWWRFRINTIDGQLQLMFRTFGWWNRRFGEYHNQQEGRFQHTYGYGCNAGSLASLPSSYRREHRQPVDMLYEFGHIALFAHWLGRLTSEPLLKFPEYRLGAATQGSTSGSAELSSGSQPCPTCGKEIAKTARTCPNCGEHLRSRRKPSGWRQKACSNCGEVMSRFAEKCQQPDCGHPNTWLKLQTFTATLAVLAGGVWSVLHFQQHQFQGLLLPALLTAAALAWRLALGLLKSFYSH